MRFRLMHVLALAVAAAAAGTGAADTVAPSTDVGGDWHFRCGGGSGAVLLHFPTPQFGVFDVRGAGYTTLFPLQAFAVSDDAPQRLAFSSKGIIHGVIALEDTTRTIALGQLTITKGSLASTLDRLVLSGTLALNGQAAKKIKLVGRRLTPPPVPMTGRTFDGVLVGRGVRSTKYDIQVYDESTTNTIGIPPVLGEGYPFFLLRSGGAASVDGREVPDSRIDGLIAADASGKTYGRVLCSDFGPGVLVGHVSLDNPVLPGVPVLDAQIRTDTGRRLHLSGVLQPFGN